jgi:hypothetical protein
MEAQQAACDKGEFPGSHKFRCASGGVPVVANTVHHDQGGYVPMIGTEHTVIMEAVFL